MKQELTSTKKYNKRVRIYAICLLIVVFLPLFSVFTRTTVHKGNYYSTKKEVALYLYKYKELPINYISKEKSKLENKNISDGWCIGGDLFQNKEKRLPKLSRNYYIECDIDYKGTEDRGRSRLVFVNDCSKVYYTDKHYDSFKNVTKFSINATSNLLLIVSFLSISVDIVYIALIFKDKNKKELFLIEIKYIPSVYIDYLSKSTKLQH